MLAPYQPTRKPALCTCSSVSVCPHEQEFAEFRIVVSKLVRTMRSP